MLVMAGILWTNINAGKYQFQKRNTEGEYIYTCNDYGTHKDNINKQSVKIHIHECFQNAETFKNACTLKSGTVWA